MLTRLWPSNDFKKWGDEYFANSACQELSCTPVFWKLMKLLYFEIHTHQICARPDPAVEVPDGVHGGRRPHLAVTRHCSRAGGIRLASGDGDRGWAIERQSGDDAGRCREGSRSRGWRRCGHCTHADATVAAGQGAITVGAYLLVRLADHLHPTVHHRCTVGRGRVVFDIVSDDKRLSR